MEVQFKRTKTISIFAPMSATSGSFASDKQHLYFEPCRERFATQWHSRSSGLYFKHGPGQGINVAGFILKTEEILQENKFSQFALTSCDDVLWVEPAKFWMRCKMRRSLFTILLRAGRKYDIQKNNYETILFSEPHINDTRKAVMRFLFGFTKYVGQAPSGSSTLESNGWVAILRDKEVSYLKSNFLSPKRKPYRPVFDLGKEIWI